MIIKLHRHSTICDRKMEALRFIETYMVQIAIILPLLSNLQSMSFVIHEDQRLPTTTNSLLQLKQQYSLISPSTICSAG
jgi:hypothetical protein